MCVLFASPPGVVQNQVFAAASPPAGQRYRSPLHALTYIYYTAKAEIVHY